MSASPSERFDPWRLADRRAVLDGSLDVRDLHRLQDLVLGAGGDVSYRIRFERDEENRILVRGALSADLILECQRCLQPLSFPVSAELTLAVVKGLDEARQLPEPYDPLLVEDGLISPVELVEEELLLALPQIPRHSDCGGAPVPLAASGEGGLVSPVGDIRESPFAVLAGLRSRIEH